MKQHSYDEVEHSVTDSHSGNNLNACDSCDEDELQGQVEIRYEHDIGDSRNSSPSPENGVRDIPHTPKSVAATFCFHTLQILICIVAIVSTLLWNLAHKNNHKMYLSEHTWIIISVASQACLMIVSLVSFFKLTDELPRNQRGFVSSVNPMDICFWCMAIFGEGLTSFYHVMNRRFHQGVKRSMLCLFLFIPFFSVCMKKRRYGYETKLTRDYVVFAGTNLILYGCEVNEILIMSDTLVSLYQSYVDNDSRYGIQNVAFAILADTSMFTFFFLWKNFVIGLEYPYVSLSNVERHKEILDSRSNHSRGTNPLSRNDLNQVPVVLSDRLDNSTHHLGVRHGSVIVVVVALYFAEFFVDDWRYWLIRGIFAIIVDLMYIWWWSNMLWKLRKWLKCPPPSTSVLFAGVVLYMVLTILYEVGLGRFAVKYWWRLFDIVESTMILHIGDALAFVIITCVDFFYISLEDLNQSGLDDEGFHEFSKQSQAWNYMTCFRLFVGIVIPTFQIYKHKKLVSKQQPLMLCLGMFGIAIRVELINMVQVIEEVVSWRRNSNENEWDVHSNVSSETTRMLLLRKLVHQVNNERPREANLSLFSRPATF